MMFNNDKKKKKQTPYQEVNGIPAIIDLTDFIDDDIMDTDVLGSYTGVPRQNADDEFYETPVQDADDL